MTRVPGHTGSPAARGTASRGATSRGATSHGSREAAERAVASDWIALGEASRLLGISEGTLRRWADEGRVAVFTTPGGHRRFSRRTLHGLLPSNRTRRPALAGLGASAERIARAYRRPARLRAGLGVAAAPAASGSREGAGHAERTDGTVAAAGGAPAWTVSLGPADRERFRERGRRMVDALLAYLDADEPDEHARLLQAACQLAAAHGRDSAELGASLSDAVEAFLQFRAPFIRELVAVARHRGLDTREATDLLVEAEAAMDRLLVATMTGHSLAGGPRAAASGTGGAGGAGVPVGVPARSRGSEAAEKDDPRS